MKTLGYALLVIGTIVASLGGAKLPSASVTITAIGLAILVVALVCLRLSARSAPATSAQSTHGDAAALVAQLPERIAKLAGDAKSLELALLPARIDAIFAELVTPVVDASPSFLPKLGANRFADVFSAFASAERALARAWSAAADGHAAEAHASLDRAEQRARQAAKALAG